MNPKDYGMIALQIATQQGNTQGAAFMLRRQAELLPCDAFQLVAEIGTDWERAEAERRRHERIMENLSRAQLALPIIENATTNSEPI